MSIYICKQLIIKHEYKFEEEKDGSAHHGFWTIAICFSWYVLIEVLPHSTSFVRVK